MKLKRIVKLKSKRRNQKMRRKQKKTRRKKKKTRRINMRFSGRIMARISNSE
jgi:hypothetical protein